MKYELNDNYTGFAYGKNYDRYQGIFLYTMPHILYYNETFRILAQMFRDVKFISMKIEVQLSIPDEFQFDDAYKVSFNTGSQVLTKFDPNEDDMQNWAGPLLMTSPATYSSNYQRGVYNRFYSTVYAKPTDILNKSVSCQDLLAYDNKYNIENTFIYYIIFGIYCRWQLIAQDYEIQQLTKISLMCDYSEYDIRFMNEWHLKQDKILFTHFCANGDFFEIKATFDKDKTHFGLDVGEITIMEEHYSCIIHVSGDHWQVYYPFSSKRTIGYTIGVKYPVDWTSVYGIPWEFPVENDELDDGWKKIHTRQYLLGGVTSNDGFYAQQRGGIYTKSYFSGPYVFNTLQADLEMWEGHFITEHPSVWFSREQFDIKF